MDGDSHWTKQYALVSKLSCFCTLRPFLRRHFTHIQLSLSIILNLNLTSYQWNTLQQYPILDTIDPVIVAANR